MEFANSEKMKASVYTRYGQPEVLKIKTLDIPAPADDELLVKVHAVTVNRSDCAMLTAKPFIMRFGGGLFRPKKQILGTDFAGEVVLAGKNVSHFKKGDKVFGFDDSGLLTHAQYTSISDKKAISLMPENTSFEEAVASLEGAHYAYNFINKVVLEKGHKVLINGATGAIGSACLQLCVYFGAKVTAVCNTNNIDLVRSLGAARIIDYTNEDFTRDGNDYDFVFDTVGKSSFGKCKPLLKPGGIYISSELGWMAENIYYSLFTPLYAKLPVPGTGKMVKFPMPFNILRSVHIIKDLVEKGKFKPVIDRLYPLEDIAEAFSYVLSGQKTGNVVIKMD
jgi:NADPH:quinone reductase-like Zn-dependent oxidoreductase